MIARLDPADLDARDHEVLAEVSEDLAGPGPVTPGRPISG